MQPVHLMPYDMQDGQVTTLSRNILVASSFLLLGTPHFSMPKTTPPSFRNFGTRSISRSERAKSYPSFSFQPFSCSPPTILDGFMCILNKLQARAENSTLKLDHCTTL